MKHIILLLCLTAFTSFAGKKELRHHEAHVHGAATLNIAFDQQKGVLRFQAAADGILGFEHQPKTEKEKQKLAMTIRQFETDISKMIQFSNSANCSFQKEQIGFPEKEKGQHLNFVANFQVQCQSSIQNTQVTFNFTGFPELHDIDVTILMDDLQKSVELKSKPLTVQLKKD